MRFVVLLAGLAVWAVAFIAADTWQRRQAQPVPAAQAQLAEPQTAHVVFPQPDLAATASVQRARLEQRTTPAVRDWVAEEARRLAQSGTANAARIRTAVQQRFPLADERTVDELTAAVRAEAQRLLLRSVQAGAAPAAILPQP